MLKKSTYEELEKQIVDLQSTVAEQTRIIERLSKYQDIISSTPDGIALLDKEYKHVIVNDTYECFSGKKRGSLIGLSISEYLGEEVFEKTVQPQFDRCLQDEIINFQEWFEYPTVGRKYVDVMYFPYRDSTGSISGVVANIRDRTETRLSEERSRQSGENYQNLFDRMLDGFALHEIICDSSGIPVDYRFLIINQSFEKLTGLKAEELIGRTVLEVLPDTERNWIDIYGKVALSGEPIVFESYSQELGKHFEVSAYRPAQHQFACIFQDVTPRKIAEQKLRDALEFNKLIVKTSPIGVLIFKESGPCVLANRAATQIAKASEEQLLQLNFREMDSYKRTGILEEMETVLETEEVRRSVVRTVNTFGKDVWFDGYISCFKANGEKHILFLFLDIWERKMLEQQLVHQHAEFQAIFNSITDSIILVDLSRHILRVNPAFEKIFGYDFEDVDGKTTHFLYSNPEEYFEQGMIRYTRDAHIAQSVYEVEYRRKDGTLFPGETLGVPVKDSQGEIIGFLGVIRDVTERKEAEKTLKESQIKLQKLLDTIQAGVVVHDVVGDRVIDFNPTAQELLGLTTEQILGKSTAEPEWAFINEDGERMDVSEYPVNIVKRTGKILPDYIIGIERPDESEPVWVVVRATPQFDDTGELSQVILSAMDITEIKKMQAQIREQDLQLVQSQKIESIGTLAGGIAHDFNNILAAVIGYAEMAREDCPKESMIAYDLDRVLEASHRAKELVQQILSFSRQADTQRVSFAPATLVKETIKMLRPAIPSTIEIVQDIDHQTNPIYADPTQINQVLMNLCTNAYHALEQSGGTLSISLHEEELKQENLSHHPDIEEGSFIKLSVSDTGPGIPSGIIEKIFDPFFTTKETGKGTGMGLSIVHGIVKKYGGFISVESKPGEGSTFHVFLPIDERVNDGEETQVGEQVPLGQERILFIDDEELITEMVQASLGRLGYNVTVRNSSLEALETFQNQPDQFDLVITDQTMPGMTGMDLSRRMLQIRPDIPIILCTGYSSTISKEKAELFGIREFAFKPVSRKTLAVLIRKALGSQ